MTRNSHFNSYKFIRITTFTVNIYILDGYFSNMTKYNREYVVDLWKTGAHGIEVGIKKEDQLRAKSRQFTKDMDIIGEVKKDGAENGYIAFREDPWKRELPNKCVILKYFSKSINWKASLEQLVAKSIMQSQAADLSLPTFMINISKTDYLITVEKIRRRPKMGKDMFAFNIIDEEMVVNTFSIETDRFSIGSDWFVYDQRRNKIAQIDGAKFNIGGKFTIEIDTTNEHYHKALDTVLILFSALNRYLDELEKDLEKSIDMIKDGKIKAEITKEEAMLYLNPRRIKM